MRRARDAAKAAGLCAALALPAGAAGPFSLFASTAPGGNQTVNDVNSVELGLRFRPSQNGHITGIRFYKFPANNGPHSGRLWTNGGALLGTVNFTGESASGWQTALFATPIAVTSGTSYVASYHTNTGYAATRFYFTAPRDVPPLHAPASAPGSLNGVYLYGTTPGFPTQSTRQSNYWVDVLFTTPEAPSTSCVTSSGGVFQNRSFATQSGQFDAFFQATPGQNNMDGQVGLSNGAADAFTDLATIVRFNGSGFIDARNGGVYAASLAVPYTAGMTYRFRLRVNVPTHEYSVFVSTLGGGERLLASQFDFRTEQAAVAQLNNMALRAGPGSATVCHFAVTPVAPAFRISGILPGSARAGGPGFTLRIFGSGFTPSLLVRWNNSARPTTFIDSDELQAEISSADIASPGNASVTVADPAPGGAESEPAAFVILGQPTADWLLTGSVSAGRADTATLVPDGRVLATTGDAENRSPAELYTRSGGSWTLAGETEPWHNREALLLENGKVLITGGAGQECCSEDAELFDPSVGVSSPTGPMVDNRADHTLTLLPDGRVLAVGGQDGSEAGNSQGAAERYDPATGVWSPTAPMAVARQHHAATLLSNGRVLVTGGRDRNVSEVVNRDSITATAELFDPAAGTWSPAASMSVPRVEHRAVRLTDGRVLVIGGATGLEFDPVASAEIYNPASGSWSPAAPMSVPRKGHSATLLANGRVLVAGGHSFPDGAPNNSAEIYDPAANAWTSAGFMHEARSFHNAVTLTSGEVLMVGRPGSAELFRGAPSTGPARSAVVVSLTFDDGSAGQRLAGQLLADRGLKGTFYVNSAQLGTSGFYMTLADVQGLAAAGHEIGGHTLHHVDLTTVTATEARRQVCDDRAQLAAWGFDPVSFAYPFGRFNDSVKAITRDCGYASGRAVDAGFSVAESTPPADAFAIRTPDAITSSQTLTALQRLVLDAEQGGGGWVPLVFHQICNGCSPLSTSSATLAAFLDWLSARGPLTTVKTVRDIVPAPPGAFSDSFTQPDGLITNENPASPRSPKWLVTEGSLFASGGQGWTGVPDDVAPNATSSNGTGSAVFRALSVSTSLRSDVTARVTVEQYVSVLAPNAFDGAHFFLRFLDNANYYHVSIRRRDGRAAIKKRRNGAISTFTTPLYGAPPVGSTLTARAVAVTNPSGSVSLQLFVNGALVASAVDTANPIATPGRVGIAAENTRLRFDDFFVPAATAPAGGGMGPAALAAAAHLSRSFAPAEALVRAAFGGRVEREDGTGVQLPESALAADTRVRVDDADCECDREAKQRARLARKLEPGSSEIEFSPARVALSRPVTLTLAYSPALLEEGGVAEGSLQVYAWEPGLADWRALPTTVDRDAKTVSAQATGLGVYQAMGPAGIRVAADPSFGWKSLYAFPNPARGRGSVTFRAQPGVADSLELHVYDLSGRRVHASSDFRGLGAFDDGNGAGAQFTYEHVWDLSGVGSGVYRYVITARKAGEAELRRSGKLGVAK